jgi:glyoxylase-like metal-dependent hydrolase (beta-lactamase superfamily II)
MKYDPRLRVSTGWPGGEIMIDDPLIMEVRPSLCQVDLLFNTMLHHSSCYIVKDEAVAIIESGTGKAVPRILHALEKLEIALERVHYVIVTHVHLDHAGGAGELLSHLPHARLVVHKGGARHLIDPTKLMTSAREVYGQRFDELFGDMHPVREERVAIFDQEMHISLGSRTLVLHDAPGHSYHHLIIHSPRDEGIFTGDSAGVLIFPFSEPGLDYSILTTTPTQFNPQAMKESLKMMEALAPEYLFLTHFGAVSGAAAMLRRSSLLVDEYMRIGMESMSLGEEAPALAGRLKAFHQQELESRGITPDDPRLALLDMDLSLNASGLLHFIKKQLAADKASQPA